MPSKRTFFDLGSANRFYEWELDCRLVMWHSGVTPREELARVARVRAEHPFTKPWPDLGWPKPDLGTREEWME